MKTRSAIKIAGLLVALIFLFAALPSQTQDTSDLSIDNLQFAIDNEKWKLKWKSEGVPDDVQVQFSSVGVIDVWTSVSATLSVHPSGNRSATFNPPLCDPAGLTVDLRMRVAACSLVGRTVQCLWTSGGDFTWAYTSTTFDSDYSVSGRC